MSIAEKLRKLLDIKAAIKEALFFVGQEVADKMEDWAMSIRNVCNVPFENLGYDDEGARAYNRQIRKAYENGIRIKNYMQENAGDSIINCLRELRIFSSDYEFPSEPYCLPDMWDSYKYMPGFVGNRTCFSFPTKITEKIGITQAGFLRGCTGLIKIKIEGDVKDYSSLGNDCPFLESIEFDASKSTIGSEIASSSLGQQCFLKEIKISNLGMQETCNALNLRTQHSVGMNTNDYPDARANLIYTLLDSSFDRASAGYSVFTITLSQETFNLLTEEEITAITNKGYTITV